MARYEAAALQVAQSQAFKDYLASQGYEALAANGAQFAKIIREGSAKWESRRARAQHQGRVRRLTSAMAPGSQTRTIMAMSWGSRPYTFMSKM